MTRLIIAEKPDMGKKIALALAHPHRSKPGYIETGDGIVSWCKGHLFESFSPEDYNPKWEKWNINDLPLLIDEWKIKPTASKKSQLDILKTLLKNSSEVINAGDPGREGQLIVDELLFYFNYKKPTKRLLLHSLDKKTITKAFNELKNNKEYYNLYLAGVARGFADWLIGMNGTRLYTLLAQKTGYKGVLSVGRVQSPTISIVVNRDLEIENFIPHDYYSISATFDINNTNIKSYWKPQDSTPEKLLDSEKRLIDLNYANDIIKKTLHKNGTVIDYLVESHKENPKLPYNLSKLQIYAIKKWGVSAKDVLEACQSLYETHEALSYPRTDCQYLPENIFPESKSILDSVSKNISSLSNLISSADFSIKSSAWNDKQLSDHYGLIPTNKIIPDMNILTKLEKLIYERVCKVFLSQFYPPCKYTTVNISILCENELFKSYGKTINFIGWRSLFNNEEDEESQNDEEQNLPPLSIGDTLLCSSNNLDSKKTTPPLSFSEASLLEAMTNVHTLVSDPIQKAKLKEKKGIGQEATRTPMLENLYKRGLLIKEKTKIKSSEAARELVKILPKKITDPSLTAIWEDALDKISNGTISFDSFKNKQTEWVKSLIDSNKNINLSISQTKTNSSNSNISSTKNTSNTNQNNKKCPQCSDGFLIKRVAKTSKKEFLGCNKWPTCNYAEWPKTKK